MTMYRVHKTSRTVEVLGTGERIWRRLDGTIESILPKENANEFQPRMIGEDTVYLWLLTVEP